MSAGLGGPPLICSNALQAWLGTDIRGLPVPHVEENLTWAKRIWRDRTRSAAALSGVLNPDRVFALARVASEDVGADPRRIHSWSEAIAQMSWPDDEFFEKLHVLSEFAYLTTRQYRRAGEAKLSTLWEKKAVELARELPSVDDFLSLAEQQRTDQIRDRFLSNPCVLLALCATLPGLINLDPAEALRQILSAHRYVLQSKTLDLQDEERNWFLVQLEILSAYGHKHVGNFNEASSWLAVAAARCDLVIHPGVAKARIDLALRCIAYERHDYQDARADLSQLAQTFEQFGMRRSAILCRYLDGAVLKELGQFEEALVRLREVATTESFEIESWIQGLALIHTAEIYAKQGEPARSFATLGTAWALVRESGGTTAVGHFHAARGEILRDLGYLDAAVESYRLAVDTYQSSRFRALEAQVRVILAETLLARGCDREALSEVATALPIIETLGLMHEAVVAVALLRESLNRQSADREALTTLRRALQSLNAENQS